MEADVNAAPKDRSEQWLLARHYQPLTLILMLTVAMGATILFARSDATWWVLEGFQETIAFICLVVAAVNLVALLVDSLALGRIAYLVAALLWSTLFFIFCVHREFITTSGLAGAIALFCLWRLIAYGRK